MGRLGTGLTRALDPMFPRGGRHARALCAGFLAVDLAVAAVALAVHDSGSGSPRTGSAQAASQSGLQSGSQPAPPSGSSSSAADARSLAVTWMTDSLPHSAPVLADDAVRSRLAARGFASAGRPTHPRYTVSTPALRRVATAQPAVADVLHDAVPIAVFTTREGPLVVGEVVDVAAATLARHRAGDARLRRSAGHGLLRNPAFSAAASTRAALDEGRLDLRAATALALLAANGTVELQGVTSVAAETQAGLPCRTVTFRAAPQSRQRALLLGLTEGYRPQTWTRLPSGSYRVTWPIRADPDDTRR